MASRRHSPILLVLMSLCLAACGRTVDRDSPLATRL